MVRLGGTATASHMAAFQGLEIHFKRLGIELEWVLYSDEQAVVDAFVAGEIQLAWNGPLNYVRIKDRLSEPCRVVAMRDVDFNFVTHFITHPNSEIFTAEDLIGKRFAFGSRSSVEAGLLAHYFLMQLGINPRRDMEATFFEERHSSSGTDLFDQKDVIEQVLSGEYDAGVVSGQTLSTLTERGIVSLDAVRVFWTSPAYSHCCFTAQGEMEPDLLRRVEQAFASVDSTNHEGRAILQAEDCNSLHPGIYEGWEFLEKAAREEGLL